MLDKEDEIEIMLWCIEHDQYKINACREEIKQRKKHIRMAEKRIKELEGGVKE